MRLCLVLLNVVVSCFLLPLAGNVKVHAQIQDSNDDSAIQQSNAAADPQSNSSPNSAVAATDATTNAQGRTNGRIPNVRSIGNSPDDVTRQLSDGNNTRVDSLFRAGPLTPLKRGWTRINGRLSERFKLDLGLNYTTLYQHADQALPNRRRDAMAGDLDFFGSLQLTKDECRWPGKLVFNSEGRHANTAVSPQQLGGQIGSLWGTSVGFNERSFTLTQLYWEKGSYENGAVVRFGRMDPALIYDGGQFVSDNYAFLSPAFSDTLPITYPGPGFGLVGAVYPTENTYVIAGAHDANGTATTAGWNSFFGQGEFFSAVELGYTPNYEEPDAGNFHITFWYSDARADSNQPHDRGIALTLEQQFGEDGQFVPFLRYATSDKGLGNGVQENVSLGFGLYDVFGQNEDILGFACSWGEPSDRSLRDQYVFESFYRIMITPHTHISPDLQVIIDPSNAADSDAIAVFGFRLRTLY